MCRKGCTVHWNYLTWRQDWPCARIWPNLHHIFTTHHCYRWTNYTTTTMNTNNNQHQMQQGTRSKFTDRYAHLTLNTQLLVWVCLPIILQLCSQSFPPTFTQDVKWWIIAMRIFQRWVTLFYTFLKNYWQSYSSCHYLLTTDIQRPWERRGRWSTTQKVSW